MLISIADTAEVASASAAAVAAWRIREAISERGIARLILAAAPSQELMLSLLTRHRGIEWERVEIMHMDEYRGIPAGHPQSFSQWLRSRLETVGVGKFHSIATTGDAVQEIARYSSQLAAAPIDLVCCGIGVNGHIAFNEPYQSKFDDERLVTEIELAEASRQQQVEDGCFPELSQVPKFALTLTIPALMRGRALIATVVGERKAAAVRDALTGPVEESCPASVIQLHPAAAIYVDRPAASALPFQVSANR